jgi:hypothetical protein
MATLLAMLVACPFTAPFRVCKTPQIATAPGPHVHRPASHASDVVRVEADAVPLASPASVAEDPLKEDVLLSDGHRVTVAVAHVSAAPPLVAGRDVLRPVVGALRL